MSTELQTIDFFNMKFKLLRERILRETAHADEATCVLLRCYNEDGYIGDIVLKDDNGFTDPVSAGMILHDAVSYELVLTFPPPPPKVDGIFIGTLKELRSFVDELRIHIDD